MGSWVLVIDIVAMDDDSVANFPVADRGAHSKHHARCIGSHYVKRLVMASAPRAFFAKTLEKSKRRKRLKN